MHLHGQLDDLAPELCFAILSLLPDLESLDNFLQASPAAYRTFELRGIEIFEAILLNGITHKYTCAIIRIIALLDSSALPPQIDNLASLRPLLLQETTPHRYNPPQWTSPPLKLTSETSISALHRILILNRKIQRLTFGCLKYYFDRFKAMTPSHLEDESFQFRSEHTVRGGDYSHFIGPWKFKPVEILFRVYDVGSICWVEQQGVLRAFWRIELLHQLAIVCNGSKETWAAEDITELDRKNVIHFYHVPLDICSDDYTVIGNLLMDKEPEYVHRVDTLLEHELLSTALCYMQQCPELIEESAYRQLTTDSPYCYARITGEAWKTVSRTHDSRMWNFFFQLSGYPRIHNPHILSPLQHVHFEPYRRLGFALWSDERMAGYGLLYPRNSVETINPQSRQRVSIGTEASCYTAWRSILTAQERNEANRVNKQHDEMAIGT